jgi:peptidoglycan hydrolase-like protein with peptidoglycan-binding domain
MTRHWLAAAAALSLLTGTAIAETPSHNPSIQQPNAAGKMKPTAVNLAPTKALQASLNRNGAAIAVDGMMGPKTTAAIKDFQRAYGLRVTGTADTPTRDALDYADSRPATGNASGSVLWNREPAGSAQGSAGAVPAQTRVAPAMLEFPEEPDNGGYKDD